MITSNLLSPMLPAISSMQVSRTPQQMGDLLIRSTRIGFATLIIFGLPLMLGGYPLMTLWLGSAYAAKSVLFLEVLVAGNIVRQLGFPYALFIVATGKQRYATVAPIIESIVNILLSVLLAQRYGAIGVALGTLIAAFVGLSGHLFISMHYTQTAITVQRTKLVLHGVLRPAISLLPTFLLLPFWHHLSLWPANPAVALAWFLSTAALLWWVGLASMERDQVQRKVQQQFGRVAAWRSA
jgi:O-antigen/teichoic acid export membrane protein